MNTPDTTAVLRTPPTWAHALLVFAVAAFWLLWLSGGRVHYEPDGAKALHVAQNLVDGYGVSVNTVAPGDIEPLRKPSITKPPLYTAALAVAVKLGLSPRGAGLAISVLACSFASTALFWLARSVLPLLPALMVPALFLLQVTTIRWGISVHEEALFVGLSLATLWQLARVRTVGRLSPYFWLGVLAALSMLASYQGLPLILVCTIYVLYLSRGEGDRRRFLLFGAGIGITAIWPFLRFLGLWLDGVRPGFDVAHESAYYKMLAGIASSFQNDVLGRQLVWLYDGSAFDLVVLSGFYLMLALLLAIVFRNRSLRPLALYTGLYLAVLVLQLGGQGKGIYEPRYSMPIYGVLILFMVYVAFRLTQRWRRLRIPGVGIGALLVAFFAWGQINRYSALLGPDTELCPAPKSFQWLQSNIPVGAVILATQCGYRLLVESNAYYWMPIPPARDVANPTRWGEDEFVAACGTSENIWVLLLDGQAVDPFREIPGYGPFVDRLFVGKETSRIELVERLDDGIVYRVKCPVLDPDG